MPDRAWLKKYKIAGRLFDENGNGNANGKLFYFTTVLTLIKVVDNRDLESAMI